MSKMRLAGISAIALVIAGVTLVVAADIATKRLVIKDNANPAKRMILVKSSDAQLVFAAGDDPITNGAAIHVYSATDDFCLSLPGGAGWTNMGGTKWKYLNTTTKNLVLQGNAKLVVKVKSGVTYTLADNGTQGAVNAQVQIGNGPRSCMRCSVPKKDNAARFIAANCAAAPCDPEPSTCNPPTTTTTTTSSTTTTTTTSTTTTTCGSPMGAFVVGALTPTVGRFNYNLTLGLPGANSACNANYPGSHACSYAELQAGEAACDLPGLKDVNNNAVNSFWAIDGAQPPLQQCQDDAIGGTLLNWEYATAHTASRGQKVTLNNTYGVLGPLLTSVQCNISGTSNVGCCQ